MKEFINLFVILAFTNTVRLVSTEEILELPVTMKMGPPVSITMNPPLTKTLELPVSTKKPENSRLNKTVAGISGPPVSISSIPSLSDIPDSPISKTAITSEVTILKQPVSTTSITPVVGISSEPPVSTTLNSAVIDIPSLATTVEKMASKSLEPPLTTSTTTTTTPKETIAYRSLEQPISTTLKSTTTTTLNFSGSLTNEPTLTTTLEPSVTRDEGPTVTTTEFNPCLVEPPKMPDFSAPNQRISEQKCYEYIWNTENREMLLNQRSACRHYLDKYLDPEDIPDHVYGGREAHFREFPHMGALGWKAVITDWAFKCGSTLISDKFLLTAAHCTRVASGDTTVTDPEPKIVRLGLIEIKDPTRIPSGSYDHTISRIIKHPKYRAPIQYYDIALIELEKNVKFNADVHPACLWTSSDTRNLDEQNTFISGWGEVKRGRTSWYTEVQSLQVATVNFIDSQICDDLLRDVSNRKWWGISEHQICAGNLTGDTDTCQGDSGGPIQVPIFGRNKDPENATDLTESMNYVVAVTSFGIGCGEKNYPGVYTRVSSFVDWIEGIVWPDEFKERYISLIWTE